MFGTIEAAIDYIKSKIADFYGRQFETDQLYQAARANLQEAYAQNRLISEAQASLAEAIDMVNGYYDLQQKLKPLADAFNVPIGLGVFPIAVTTAIWALGGITAVILTAELLWGYYQRLDTQRIVIQQVKDGLLPPDVLTRPPPAGPIEKILGSVSTLAIVGLGAWLILNSKR